MLPSFGFKTPNKHLSKVDLPEPFGPTKPKKLPSELAN